MSNKKHSVFLLLGVFVLALLIPSHIAFEDSKNTTGKANTCELCVWQMNHTEVDKSLYTSFLSSLMPSSPIVVLETEIHKKFTSSFQIQKLLSGILFRGPPMNIL